MARTKKKDTQDTQDDKADENSLDNDNPAYVGVSPEYKNSAIKAEAPAYSDDEDLKAAEEAAKAHEVAIEEASANIGHRGYEPTTPHPSKAKQPASDTIERNRRIIEDADPGADEDDDDDEKSPFS